MRQPTGFSDHARRCARIGKRSSLAQVRKVASVSQLRVGTLEVAVEARVGVGEHVARDGNALAPKSRGSQRDEQTRGGLFASGELAQASVDDLATGKAGRVEVIGTESGPRPATNCGLAGDGGARLGAHSLGAAPATLSTILAKHFTH